jgi:hypothetical protein
MAAWPTRGSRRWIRTWSGDRSASVTLPLVPLAKRSKKLKGRTLFGCAPSHSEQLCCGASGNRESAEAAETADAAKSLSWRCREFEQLCGGDLRNGESAKLANLAKAANSARWPTSIFRDCSRRTQTRPSRRLVWVLSRRLLSRNHVFGDISVKIGKAA